MMRTAKFAAAFVLIVVGTLITSAITWAKPQSAATTIIPTSFNFGSEPVGGPPSGYPFTLSNSSAAAISITSVAISPAGSQSYAVQNLCQSTLAANSSCEIYVTFAPVSLGEKSYTLQIVTTGGTVSAALTGVGTAPPLVLIPASLAFGSAAVGLAATQSSAVTNTATYSVSIASIKVGSNSQSYTETNNCPPNLASGASCTVSVTYNPVSVGVKDYAVVIRYDDFTATLPVTGTATAAPISLLPATLAFGTQQVGSSSTLPVSVTNTSQSTVAITSFGFTPGKQSYTQTNNCPTSLGAGKSCVLKITFNPQSAGTKNYAAILSYQGATQEVRLTGGAVPSVMQFTPSAGVYFGSSVVGNHYYQLVELENNSSAAVAISSIGITPVGSQSLSQSNNCPKSLGAGNSCVIEVVFDPVSIGNKDFTLTVVDSAGSQSIPVQGIGTQQRFPSLGYTWGPVTGGFSADYPSLRTADFNGDGKPDFIVAGEGGSDVSVFLNNGDGTFASPVSTPITFPDGAFSLDQFVVADFNNDGKPDVVIGTYNGASPVDFVLLGKGDGTFTEATPIPASGAFWAGASGDLNGDGNIDYVAGRSNGIVDYRQGKGDGTFQPAVSIFNCAGDPITGVTLGDFNGDKKLDVAIVCFTAVGPGKLAIVLGNGDGTFQPAITQPVDNEYVGTVQVADFNHDGRLDLLLDYQGSAAIAYGDGTGHFSTGNDENGSGVVVYTSSQNLSTDIVATKVADVDGDGLPDMVATDWLLGGLNIVLNPGLGKHPVPPNTSISMPLSPKISDIAVADFNDDGFADVVAVNSQTGEITVFLSGLP
jgi:hypothetical protein